MTAKVMRQMRPLGLRGIAKAAFLFKEVFITNCANHSNFIDPRYYLEEEGKIIPYSISPHSIEVCSSCAEYFDIVGSKYKTKLVVPCVGAVLYAGMAADRYYKVQKM